MVAKPDVSRANGAKSKGPKTERGKAIASRNATKHGLLAEKPPLLASEDLETFQDLMQGLVDHYQPGDPVEWHLVQQVAMAMQRQQRLWAAEAAMGNQGILPRPSRPVTDSLYPEIEMDGYGSVGHPTEWHPDNIAIERRILGQVLEQLTADGLPSRRIKDFKFWWDDYRAYLRYQIKPWMERYPCKPDEDKVTREFREQEQERNSPWSCLDTLYIRVRDYLSYDKRTLTALIEQAREASKARLAQLDRVVAEIAAAREEAAKQNREYQAAIAPVHTIPEQIGLLMRYESHINKQLIQAVEQLEKLKQQRSDGGSIGSFGKTASLSVV